MVIELKLLNKIPSYQKIERIRKFAFYIEYLCTIFLFFIFD